jgi:hypothetical protein
MKLLPLALLAALGASGCVDVNRTLIKTEESVIASTPKTVVSSRFTADTRLDGTILKVLVTPQCADVEQQTVERTDHYEKTLKSDDVAWNTALSIVGAGPMIGGTAMLADVPNVHDSNMNGRLYNEAGKEVAIGVGTMLLGLGLACALPPLANGIRATGSSEEKSMATRLGPTLKERVACPASLPLPPYAVVARFTNGQTVGLGSAQASDELHVDLRAALGPSILGMSPAPTSVAIWINEKFQTEIPTTGLLDAAKTARDEADEAAWVQAEPSACRLTQSSCGKVQGYLSKFPNGLHAEEARKLLAPRTNVVAADPDDAKLDAAADAAAAAYDKAETQALEKLDKEVKKACEAACDKGCGKDKKCRDLCILQVCP